MSDQPPVSPPSLPEIVQRYRNGESVQTLAQESKTSLRTLYYWLFKAAGPGHEDLQTECFISRLADADYMLLQAETKLQVARARECMKTWRLDFERRRPELYGPRLDVKQDTSITVIVDRSAPPVIDITPHTPTDKPLVVQNGTVEVIENTESAP